MKKILVLILLITSCATHKTEYTFVKVLGITPEGDTILIDVNSLRPKIYNNYYRHYNNNYARPYFYNPPVIIRPHNTNSNTSFLCLKLFDHAFRLSRTYKYEQQKESHHQRKI